MRRSISLRKARAKKLQELKATTTHSLVADSIRHVEEDEEHILTADALRKLGQEKLTREERVKRRRALDTLGVPTFDEFLAQKKLALDKGAIEILQLNIGLYCNQACNHCHVESSPKRTEMMTEEVARRCMHLMEKTPSVTTLDLTGGAPEMNSQFRYLVTEGRRQGKEVIDRCNLTVLSEPGYEDLVQFLADNQVRVVASLPCYSEKNVNTQRGAGVFDKSILGLIKLNQAGYGVEGSGLHLDLIYNPLGAFLPPEQSALEAKYRTELAENFGVVFSSLFTLSNMPIKRFADFLHRRGELAQYMDLLVRNFNPATVQGLMCSNLVSVGYTGAFPVRSSRLRAPALCTSLDGLTPSPWNLMFAHSMHTNAGQMFDCDFNQQLATHMVLKNAKSPEVGLCLGRRGGRQVCFFWASILCVRFYLLGCTLSAMKFPSRARARALALALSLAVSLLLSLVFFSRSFSLCFLSLFISDFLSLCMPGEGDRIRHR